MRQLRDAIRQWARTPIITLVVVASLALGIGANTAIFSLIDSLLLKPLPVRYAERLVRIHSPRDSNHSIPTFEQLRDGDQIFDAIAAVSLMRPDVSSTAERRSAQGLAVSGRFFDTLGIAPALGRLLGPGDDRTGESAPAAILEYHYWQSAFHGQRDVVGKAIPLDGKLFTIVGVSEQGFFGPSVGRRFDVAVSLAGYQYLYPGSNRPNANFLSIIGRLRDGQSIDAAQAQLRARQPQIRAALGLPETFAQLTRPWEVMPMRTGMTTTTQERYQAPLRVLMALVAVVLVIACVNVANLLLAKGAARRGELAVRLSLGASRGQVLRSMLIESLVIGLAGAAGGLVTGIWTARSIVNAMAVNQSGALSTWIEVPLDWRMLAFTTGAGVVTAFAPDVVIIATGGLPQLPQLEAGHDLVHGAWEVIGGEITPSGDVLLYDDDGTHSAMTAAEVLVRSGARLELVTPERTMGVDVGGLNLVPYARALNEADTRISLNQRVRAVHREGTRLRVELGSDHTPVRHSRIVDAVVVDHGTLANDDLYHALVPTSRNLGEVDHQAFIAGRPQSVQRNADGAYQLFRIGDAVAGRNIHAAVYDALRLCAHL